MHGGQGRCVESASQVGGSKLQGGHQALARAHTEPIAGRSRGDQRGPAAPVPPSSPPPDTRWWRWHQQRRCSAS
eukprot:6650442-Lingulodinium_polyedra.AAC.1